MDSATQELPPQPPTPPPAVARPRLERRHDGRMLAGVARGLADYVGIDVILVRVVFVLLAFAGVGIALYLAGWVLMPAEGESTSVGDRLLARMHGAPPWLVVVLFVAAGLLLLGRVMAGGTVFWALVLIGVGVWLYHRDAKGSPVPPPPLAWSPAPGTGPGDPYAPPSAPAGDAGDAADAARGPAPLWPATWPGAARPAASPRLTTPLRPPPPPRPRSRLGRYTLAGLLVVLGMVAALDTLGVVHVAARAYPGLALLVIAAGLLVGTFFGRSRLLILAGLLVLPVAVASSVVRVPLAAGAGDRSYAPVKVADVHSPYRLGAGSLHLDLTGLVLGSSDTSIRATVAAGRMDILVPDTMTVDIHAHVGAGVIQVEDRNLADLINQDGHGGLGTTVQTTLPGTTVGAAHLVLDLDVSLGVVRVGQVGALGTPAPALPTAPATPSVLVPAAPPLPVP